MSSILKYFVSADTRVALEISSLAKILTTMKTMRRKAIATKTARMMTAKATQSERALEQACKLNSPLLALTATGANE
jgi:hypothetical protein